MDRAYPGPCPENERRTRDYLSDPKPGNPTLQKTPKVGVPSRDIPSLAWIKCRRGMVPRRRSLSPNARAGNYSPPTQWIIPEAGGATGACSSADLPPRPPRQPAGKRTGRLVDAQSNSSRFGLPQPDRRGGRAFSSRRDSHSRPTPSRRSSASSRWDTERTRRARPCTGHSRRRERGRSRRAESRSHPT